MWARVHACTEELLHAHEIAGYANHAQCLCFCCRCRPAPPSGPPYMYGRTKGRYIHVHDTAAPLKADAAPPVFHLGNHLQDKQTATCVCKRPSLLVQQCTAHTPRHANGHAHATWQGRAGRSMHAGMHDRTGNTGTLHCAQGALSAPKRFRAVGSAQRRTRNRFYLQRLRRREVSWPGSLRLVLPRRLPCARRKCCWLRAVVRAKRLAGWRRGQGGGCWWCGLRPSMHVNGAHSSLRNAERRLWLLREGRDRRRHEEGLDRQEHLGCRRGRQQYVGSAAGHILQRKPLARRRCKHRHRHRRERRRRPPWVQRRCSRPLPLLKRCRQWRAIAARRPRHRARRRVHGRPRRGRPARRDHVRLAQGHHRLV